MLKGRIQTINEILNSSNINVNQNILKEVFEHCDLYPDNYIDTHSSFKKIGNLLFECYDLQKPSLSIYRLLSDAVSGYSMQYLIDKLINPNDVDYLSGEINILFDDISDLQNVEILGFSDAGYTKYVKITPGTNPNTIKFESSDDGVNIETTDNITCDLSTAKTLRIGIKATGNYLYINDVLSASHETYFIFDVPDGCWLYGYFEPLNNVARYCDIDYMNYYVGRKF